MQSKENLTLRASSFGSKCEFPPAFLDKVLCALAPPLPTGLLLHCNPWMVAACHLQPGVKRGGEGAVLDAAVQLQASLSGIDWVLCRLAFVRALGHTCCHHVLGYSPTSSEGTRARFS